MVKKTTIILRNILGHKTIEIPCTNQCGYCKYMCDSFTCKIYPTIENDIPLKYRLGKETYPDFKQALDDNNLLV